MRPAKPEMVNSAKKMPTGSRVVIERCSSSELRMRFSAGGARTEPSRLVAGDAGVVDCVDLLGIEELARVAQVDLVAHEDVEEIGIDVPVLLHAAEDPEGFRERLAGLVGPILRGERLEDVC